MAPVVIGVWSIVDLARRTDADFAAIGQSRTTWLMAAILSLVVPCAFVAGVSYLVWVRPRFRL